MKQKTNAKWLIYYETFNSAGINTFKKQTHDIQYTQHNKASHIIRYLVQKVQKKKIKIHSWT